MRAGEHYNKEEKCLLACLRCDKMFTSWDRRRNRLCPSCIRSIRERPEFNEEPDRKTVQLPDWNRSERGWERARAREV